MSIRPVDYQILMPKINELAKVQNSEQQRQIAQIQQQAENSVQHAEQDIKRVNSQRETQKTVITEKQKKRNSSGKQNDSKENDEKNKENDSQLPKKKHQQGHIIDIRL